MNPVTTSPRSTATATALSITIALTAGCWVVALKCMRGMDDGAATALGPFAAFSVVWVSMMAAMMLPGALPGIVRRARTAGGGAVPRFVVSYLLVWSAAGLVVFALYRPHSTVVAGAMVMLAGLYELTPVKQHFRGRCRASLGSGFEFGLCCVGSSGGLMLLLLALGPMSAFWMVVVTVLGLAQKWLPARAVLDVPLALAITGFGILVILAPAALTGVLPQVAPAMMPAM